MRNNTLNQSFQNFCWNWLKEVFTTPKAYCTATDPLERDRRFFEEATEYVQAGGVMSREDCHRLVDYTYDKEPGELGQELGGVMATLASSAEARQLSMNEEGWREIQRCYRPEVMEKIRNKQVSKRLHGIGGSVEEG